jgi:antitoxin component YwqK of YwqJK toxin-antitoxin module
MTSSCISKELDLAIIEKFSQVPVNFKSKTMEVVNILNTLPTVVFTDKILQFFHLAEVSELRAIDKKIKHLITTHRHRICTKICFHILPHGVETWRNEDGTIVSTSTFKEGIKHGYEKDFNDNGILIHSLEFAEGQKHGDEVHFDDYGGGMTTTPYKEGKKHGVEKFFIRPYSDRLDEVGAILRQVTPFTEGQKDGEEKHWSMQGVLMKMTPYKKGQKHGVEKIFRQVEDWGVRAVVGQMIGVLVQVSPFKEGQLHGEEKYWNNQGVLFKIIKFDEGQMTSSSWC